MATRNLLYQKQYTLKPPKATDIKFADISIVIPSVGDILQCEDEYYNLITMLTAMPVDLMCQLDDAGIDFASINDYELFILLFNELKSKDTSLIFKGIDLSKFQIAMNQETEEVILLNTKDGTIINRAIHNQIASVLRKIHHLEKNRRKPANEEAKKFMLEREKIKLARKKNRVEDSQLESLIIAMVNTEQYKYDFESTKNLSIYQFNESVRQIIKKVDYDNLMIGVYAGTVSTKELNKDDLNWLIHK